MHININFTQFHNQFRIMDRDSNFSYEGLMSLFDYLEDVNPDMELDVISICCDYSENTVGKLSEMYSIDISGLDEKESLSSVIDYLSENSNVINITAKNTIVYSQF